MKALDYQKELEKLRAQLNSGSKKIALLKNDGGDIGPHIEEMRLLSVHIKQLKQSFEKENLKAEDKALLSPEVIPNESFYFELNRKGTAERDGRLRVSCKAGFDQDLVEKIKELEKKADVFPQCRIGWVAPWIEHEGVESDVLALCCYTNDELVGVGLFLTKRVLGGLILTNCPSHYGDFYSFTILRGVSYQNVCRAIVEKLIKLSGGNIILSQINNSDTLFNVLSDFNFTLKHQSKIYSVWLRGDSTSDLLDRLSIKMRSSIRNKKRKLESRHKVEHKTGNSISEYQSVIEEFRRVVVSRRGEDLPESSYSRRLDSLKGLEGSGSFYFSYLLVDGVISAYRLGFIYHNVFYEWKSGHCSEYSQYSLGDLMTLYLLKELKKNGFDAHNFMAGEYVYKSRWATEEITTKNNIAYLFANDFRGFFLKKYFLSWRDLLKKVLVRFGLKR